ncbi:unnamed protein product [Protopolystoma xenopodis]|uniref:Uncharacterized protein n=1 Tax=Protopolystoma xenopodis TaxID=117903 RepID=A0A448WBI7_9PLAT|nr:unnamed protein product [Protopolystoma xenopodis]
MLPENNSVLPFAISPNEPGFAQSFCAHRISHQAMAILLFRIFEMRLFLFFWHKMVQSNMKIARLLVLLSSSREMVVKFGRIQAANMCVSVCVCVCVSGTRIVRTSALFTPGRQSSSDWFALSGWIRAVLVTMSIKTKCTVPRLPTRPPHPHPHPPGGTAVEVAEIAGTLAQSRCQPPRRSCRETLARPSWYREPDPKSPRPMIPRPRPPPSGRDGVESPEATAAADSDARGLRADREARLDSRDSVGRRGSPVLTRHW